MSNFTPPLPPMPPPIFTKMAANHPPDAPDSTTPVYNKHVIDRILDVIRSHPLYDQNVIEQILDIAADCEPSPPAPTPRFYYSRESGLEHVKQFAARHGYTLNTRRSDESKVDLVCSRWPDPKAKGVDNDAAPTRGRVSSGCSCSFRIQLRRRTAPQKRGLAASPENSPLPIWQLRIQNGAHNHGPKRRRVDNAAHLPVSAEMTGNDLAGLALPLSDDIVLDQVFSLEQDRELSPPEPPMFAPPPDTPEEKEPTPPAFPPGPPPAPPPRFYDSREVGQQDIAEFATSHGYSLTIKRSDQSKVDMVCSRWPNPTNPRERKTNATGCPFRLQFRRRTGAPQKPGYIIFSDPLPQTGWELRILNGEHNHEATFESPKKKKRKRKSSDPSGSPGNEVPEN